MNQPQSISHPPTDIPKPAFSPAIGEHAATSMVPALQSRITRLKGMLTECLEFLEGQVDVVDGTECEGPQPNKAMSLCSEIERVLAE